MTRSINPATASVTYRVEARMPPPSQDTATIFDFNTLEEAVTYVQKLMETAKAMLQLDESRKLGQLLLWRMRRSQAGGRVQLNLIPQSEWREP